MTMTDDRGTTRRHAGARTAQKGRATPRRGEQQAIAAQRRSRTRRVQMFVLVAVAAILVAVALVAGAGGGSGPTHGAPIPLHG